VITSAPASVTYGATFDVGTAQPDDVGTVSWIRLPSVTHSFDENQRINFLSFQRAPQKVRVTAPASANVCTPGYYMLFLLSQDGTPSVARIIQIQALVQPAGFAAAGRADVATAGVPAERPAYLQISSREAAIRRTAHGTKVVIGITGTCPYGIGSCWGGAYEALGRLEGVDLVSPVPDVEDSTAQLFLADDRLPPLQRWDEQFHRIVNGTYELRGVEVTVRGSIYQDDGQYFVAVAADRSATSAANSPWVRADSARSTRASSSSAVSRPSPPAVRRVSTTRSRSSCDARSSGRSLGMAATLARQGSSVVNGPSECCGPPRKDPARQACG
jgi:galactose oxidase